MSSFFARYGLKLMAETPHQGLRALMRASGVDGKPLTAGRVGFILAPRLNAAGRIGHAMQGVELLMSDSEPESNRIARELEEMNRRRQDIDRATLEEARRRIDAIDLDNTFGIVLAELGWHPVANLDGEDRAGWPLDRLVDRPGELELEPALR